MSTESMIRDVELAEEALPKKMGGLQNSRRCLCLSLFSFLLVAGATTLFCLLNFGVIGPQRDEVSVWAAFILTHKQSRIGGQEGQDEGKRWANGQGDVEESGERDRVRTSDPCSQLTKHPSADTLRDKQAWVHVEKCGEMWPGEERRSKR